MTHPPSTWFSTAVSSDKERGFVTVDGTQIAYRAWGPAGAPVVVLVHGGAAHSGWWDHIGPSLAERHRIVAIDLSGHGDSQWRDEYDTERWVNEVAAVAISQGDGPVTVVGHSLGGIVALAAAQTRADLISGVITVDSPPHALPSGLDNIVAVSPVRTAPRLAPDRDSLVARFRTMSPDPATQRQVLAHIAEQSVTQVEGGWRWKFDPQVLAGSYRQPADIGVLPCHVAILRAERGIAHRRPELFAEHPTPPHLPVTYIPDSGHDVMLDQPQALAASLDALIGQWSDSARTEWRITS